MKANTIRNKLAREKYSNTEMSFKSIKFLQKNLLFSSLLLKRIGKYTFNTNILKKNIGVSKVTLKAKCVLTGRNASVNKQYALSRLELRRLISLGLIPGYKKAVW